MTTPEWTKGLDAYEGRSPEEILADLEEEEKEPQEKPDILYHYTDAVGFLGVLNKKEIWASEVRCMNDAQEIEYAAGLVAEECKKFGDEFVSWKTPELSTAPSVSGLPQWIRENFDPKGEDDPYPHGARLMYKLASSFAKVARSRHQGGPNTYAACFTTEPDSLGQWRGYAGGSGYAIGFRYEALSQVRVGESGPLIGEPQRVLYGEKGGKEQVVRLYRQLGKLMLTVAQILNQNEEARKSGNPVSDEKPYLGSFGPKLPELATVKHKAFEEEREWRLILSEEYENVAELVPDFRAGGVGGVLPYLRLNVPEGAITSVRVGPGEETDLRVLMAQQALARYGHHDVKVLTSDAPYRP